MSYFSVKESSSVFLGAGKALPAIASMATVSIIVSERQKEWS